MSRTEIVIPVDVGVSGIVRVKAAVVGKDVGLSVICP